MKLLVVNLSLLFLSLVLLRCTPEIENDISLESEFVPSVSLDDIQEESSYFGNALNEALEQTLISEYEAGKTKLSELADLVEFRAVERMNRSYDENYGRGYYAIKEEMQRVGNTSGRLANVDADSLFDTDIKKEYLAELSSIFAVTSSQFASQEDSLLFDDFKAAFDQNIEGFIEKVNGETSFTDSVKHAITAAALYEQYALEARVIMMADELDMITDEDIAYLQDHYNQSGGRVEIGGVCRGAARLINRLTRPFRGNLGCIAAVFGSHIATGAVAGWLFGKQLENSQSNIVEKIFVNITSGATAIIGGAAGGLVAAYRFLRGNDGC